MADSDKPRTPRTRRTATKEAGTATGRAAARPAAAPKPKPAAKSTAAKSATAKSARAKSTPAKPRARAAKPAAPDRPWLKSYPEGIVWETEVDTTPVHEQVLAACRRQGDKPALDFLGAKTSFADLGAQIEAFAGALQKRFGVRKGTRVALMLPNTPFYPVAYYGVLRAGGTVVNCNPLYSVPELGHITANAGADLMVTLDLAMVFDKAVKLVHEGHVGKLVVCHFPNALPTVKRLLFKLVKARDLARPKSTSIADRITDYGELIRAGHAPDPVEIDPANDIAVQQYTGGTTGIPKGAMLTHANIAANVSQIDKWGLELFYEPSKVVAVLPFFHIFAMTVCLNVPLGNGIEVAMLPRYDYKSLMDLFRRTGANVLPAVPTLLHAIANNPATTSEKLEKLQVAISGGAPLPSETRAAFARHSGALLAEGYGLTECSPVVCCAALKVPSKPMSIGLPLPATDIRFADVDDPKKVVANGQRGELQVKGPQVMRGYYDNDEATKEAFVDGWLRTGDVGYIDEDGYVFLVDRIKDLIITSGFNIYPRNIEEALYRHEAVDECNVIGVPDERRGEAPVAFVKLRDGQVTTARELKEFLGQHLSKIEVPREILFRDELPKTLVGKLSKKELREDYEAMKKNTPGDAAREQD